MSRYNDNMHYNYYMKYAKSMKIFCRNSDSAMANCANKTTKNKKKFAFSHSNGIFFSFFLPFFQCKLHTFGPLFGASCAVWFCCFFFSSEMNNNNNNNFSSIQLHICVLDFACACDIFELRCELIFIFCCNVNFMQRLAFNVFTWTILC